MIYSWEGTEQAGRAVHDGLSESEPLLEAMAYLYDLRGRMNQVEIDENGDETVDVTAGYVYNPAFAFRHSLRRTSSITPL